MKGQLKISIRLFDAREVRAVWDDTRTKWWFSGLDIVGILNEDPDYTKTCNYWMYLKAALKKENHEVVSGTTQFNFQAPDGKKRMSDMLDSEGVTKLAKHVPNNRVMSFWIGSYTAIPA